MKKIILAALMAGMFAAASTASAVEYDYTFSGSDPVHGGLATAAMHFTITGNTLELILQNTSPSSTDEDFYDPAITGFGFDLAGDTTLTAWTLKAFNSDDIETTIGTTGNNSLPWQLVESDSGVSLDYLAAISGMKGALYNPDSTGILGGHPSYFTDATLTMTFASTDVLALESTYVRFQSVGTGGEGSLKLWGDEDGGGTSKEVPEPSTLLLIGAGLAGLGLWRRKSSK